MRVDLDEVQEAIEGLQFGKATVYAVEMIAELRLLRQLEKAVRAEKCEWMSQKVTKGH